MVSKSMPPLLKSSVTATHSSVLLNLSLLRYYSVSAKIIISHIFSNPSPDCTGRAKYVFPVPVRAVICGFTMKTSDGREVIGVAKESQRAEEEYRQAVEQSKVAGLVQWGADDGVYCIFCIPPLISDIWSMDVVFTISVGSIPARGVVVTKITVRSPYFKNNLLVFLSPHSCSVEARDGSYG